ncbi:asparagine synthase (glutamine-hydrolyzing) [Roseivivax sp. THAF30]|uniref:asparagine synthase (glutamine-hydrolyzing) n=1 Tax=Roseivivax sp. THAF30 TaxID=2587852 RepID=UPI0012687234|nr:asparagine synthase (glutamine-hydrolyzing) [Roseivivax sp. THAF30]QFT63695.1 Asparagine synthetase [glutamine-hydrolyzing] 1 [Roseivivax sp. THAF30]
MCGIAGFITSAPNESSNAKAILARMTETLSHRGPDADGHFVDPGGRVALGHRRLAIIDLSEAGAQPMRSASGRFEMVYNGEVYGFGGMRDALAAEDVIFRGSSDTEVLLNGIERWGIEPTLQRATGMFAFAVFDRATNSIIFARDRLGKKPLYIGCRGRTTAFASELKAIRAHPDFSDLTPDRRSVALYLRYGYVPAPRSIYEGVVKFPAGHWAAIPVEASVSDPADILSCARPYWSLEEVIAKGRADPCTDAAQAIERVDEVLSQATAERLVSDVPVGAFLSGGIDSSLIVALMQEQASHRVSTYTVRFDDDAINEADAAAHIAKHLGTAHHELTASAADALALVSDMPAVFDEPFADPSQLPTLLISRLIRSDVTVALSGDGGDESFGGYQRYWAADTFERYSRFLPRAFFQAANGVPSARLDTAISMARGVLPARVGKQISTDRLKKLTRIAAEPSFRARYGQSFTMWSDHDLVPEARLGPTGPFEACNTTEMDDRVAEMMALDTSIYLPDDVLVKVDRASMAASLEVRSPLLDHRVVELAWSLPNNLRFDGRVGKLVLRRLLERRVPLALFDRPKQGFGIPIEDWIRGPLRDLAADAVSPERLSVLSVVDPDRAAAKFDEHVSGRRNWGRHLWTLIMLDAWQDTWLGTQDSNRHQRREAVC